MTRKEQAAFKRLNKRRVNDGITGAAKFNASIFVEPCRYCQDKLEKPARMILEGINKLQAEGGAK